jgi:hypothetical protein
MRGTLVPLLMLPPFTWTRPFLPVTSNSHGSPCWDEKHTMLIQGAKKHNYITSSTTKKHKIPQDDAICIEFC